MYSIDNDVGVSAQTILSTDLLEPIERELASVKAFCWDVETSGLNPWRNHIVGHALAWRRDNGQIRSVYLPVRHRSVGAFDAVHQLPTTAVNQVMASCLGNDAVKIGHNFQFDVQFGLREGLPVRGRVHETMLCAKLIDENHKHYDLHSCLSRAGVTHDPAWKNELDAELKGAAKSFGLSVTALKQKHGYEFCTVQKLGHYALQDAVYEYRLAEAQLPYTQFWPDVWALEMKLFWVCVDIMRVGVPVDPEVLLLLAHEQKLKMAELAPRIWQLAGEQFEITNDTQVRRILFEKLGFASRGKTRGQVDRVDDDVLWDLETNERSELAGLLREYNDSDKIVSTYTEGVIARADAHNILHPELDQGGAKTGRVACLAPWTPVLTQDGLKPLSSVCVGDMVWTHRERWRRVSAVFSQGIRESVDVHLANGNILTCTSDQRFYSYSREWKQIDECFKTLGTEREQSSRGVGALSERRFEHDGGRSGEAGDDSAKCALGFEAAHAAGRVQGVGGGEVLFIENCRKESNVGEDRAAAPQLEGRMRGREGLPDLLVEGEAPVRSSHRVSGSPGPGEVSGGHGCSSHRRQSEEQRFAQSRVGNVEGASNYPLFAGEGQPGCAVEAILHRGSLEVFDLTVEEDESYCAAGVFAHNCRSPNLQNVPVRTELGRRVRSAFPARPGMVRYCLDYSQIELRILAHLTQDPILLRVYREGLDAHRTTALELFGTDQEIDGINMRSLAKVMNFGTSFCMTEFGLCKNLNKDLPAGQPQITTDRAKYYLANFYAKYAGISQYRHRLWTEVRQNRGSFVNLFGRPRHLPLIAHEDKWVREAAERQAISTMVQGSAADLVKRAMVAVWDYLKSQTICSADMVLMVHDDLQFDCEYAGSAGVIREVKRLMESTCQAKVSVPIIVDAEYFTTNWKEKKKLKGF